MRAEKGKDVTPSVQLALRQHREMLIGENCAAFSENGVSTEGWD